MTIEQWIERRNALQIRAEGRGSTMAETCWARLGILNRHITRVVSGQMALTEGLEREMAMCLDDAEKWLNTRLAAEEVTRGSD